STLIKRKYIVIRRILGYLTSYSRYAMQGCPSSRLPKSRKLLLPVEAAIAFTTLALLLEVTPTGTFSVAKRIYMFGSVQQTLGH
ncbi:MAG: hypothetical protein M3362_01780, partial [Acidobacteriota bacterium]|nr:hypothetical protein [Acidobacteriota bacterium]